MEKENQDRLPEVKTLGYINPIWEVSVETKSGETLLKKSLCSFLHTYLKDYGFDPDGVNLGQLVAKIEIAPGSVCKLPLMVEALHSLNITPEQAIELGYILKEGDI